MHDRPDMKLAPLLFGLLMACAPMPSATPPLPSTPPPSPPPRDVIAATVNGRVLDANGSPVIRTWVTVRSADAGCRPLAPEIGAITDDNGQFHAVVESPDREPHQGCVLVETRSGGASGQASAPVFFTRTGMDFEPAQVTVRLERAPPLTTVEAERLVRLLVDDINNPASQGSPDLALYINQGSEALRVALERYRDLFGSITGVRRLQHDANGVTFELQTAKGPVTQVLVHQEDLVRVHSPLIDYALRAEAFINAYVRAIASGDAIMLSRVLNPDDIDFPVEKAREMIVAYRERYGDTSRIRAELVSIDESRNSMTWRLRGGEVTELIEVVYGDGLIGIRGL